MVLKLREISDFTRESRPKLENILIETIHDVIEVDRKRSNEDISAVQYENETFYYRVIFLFLQRVVEYYDEKEVEEWCRRELLHEVILPEI